MKQMFAIVALLVGALVASVHGAPLPGTGSATLEGTISAYTTDASGEVVSFTFSGTVLGENPAQVLNNEEIVVNPANGNDQTIKDALRTGDTVKFNTTWSGSGTNKTYELDGGLRVTP